MPRTIYQKETHEKSDDANHEQNDENEEENARERI